MTALKDWVRTFVAMQRGQEPVDPGTVLICADWLEERGDERSEALRRDPFWTYSPIDPKELIRRAVDLLTMQCSACRGRPFAITVQLAPEALAQPASRFPRSRITVDTWGLKDADEICINGGGKVVRYGSPHDGVLLGRVAGQPETCDGCEGLGVTPREDQRIPAQSVHQPPAARPTRGGRSE